MPVRPEETDQPNIVIMEIEVQQTWEAYSDLSAFTIHKELSTRIQLITCYFMYEYSVNGNVQQTCDKTICYMKVYLNDLLSFSALLENCMY